jgi:hypothetical protein
MMAGADPRDMAGEAAGVPAVDGFNLLPLLLGQNKTSPRTEIFFTNGCLIMGDWKLLIGALFILLLPQCGVLVCKIWSWRLPLHTKMVLINSVCGRVHHHYPLSRADLQCCMP